MSRPVSLVDDIMRYEQGELDEDATIALFDYLVSHGMIWGLQGSYQREAQRMIDAGLIKPFDYDYDGEVGGLQDTPA